MPPGRSPVHVRAVGLDDVHEAARSPRSPTSRFCRGAIPGLDRTGFKPAESSVVVGPPKRDTPQWSAIGAGGAGVPDAPSDVVARLVDARCACAIVFRRIARNAWAARVVRDQPGGSSMREVLNKTMQPVRIPLPGGRVLHLGPGKVAQIADNAAQHPSVQRLVESGTIEVLGEGERVEGSGNSASITKPTPGRSKPPFLRGHGER